MVPFAVIVIAVLLLGPSFTRMGEKVIAIAKWKSSNPNKELTFESCNFFEVLRLVILVPLLAIVLLMSIILIVGIFSKVL